jgi:hypothetical protein
MNQYGSGLASGATEVEALMDDLLDGKIDPKDSATNGTTQENRFYVPKDIKPKRQRRTKAAKKRGRCRWVRNDGGRRAAGYDNAGDRGGCVPRAIAIASGLPYREVLDALTLATSRYVKIPQSWIARWIKRSRHGRGWDPAQGCYDTIYGNYLKSIGWQYTPVDGRLHLRADEVPPGRLIIRVHRHLVAVIDGVIHDTHDSGFAGQRPVIGYWRAP